MSNAKDIPRKEVRLVVSMLSHFYSVICYFFFNIFFNFQIFVNVFLRHYSEISDK